MYDSALASPVILPEGMTNLGYAAYAYCSNIVSASLPGTLGDVQPFALSFCTSLSKVTIGEGITSIGMAAFYESDNLDTIFVNCAVPPALGTYVDSVFTSFDATVVVPCGSQNAFDEDPIWSNFPDIIEDCGVGIPEVNLPNFTIRVANSSIIVDGAEGETVRVFDLSGRQVNNSGLANGVYIVKVGNYPARKIVVTR